MNTPRVIRGLDPIDYHAIPAMSASMALAIVERCPLLAWTESPLNPARELEEPAKHLDIGTAAHLAVLEPEAFGERVVCHEFDTYSTNAAKAIRDEAREAGKTPLRPQDVKLVHALHEAIRNSEAADLFAPPGESEVSLVWDWNGIECKARPDRLLFSRDLKPTLILDLKTAASAHPDAVARAAFNDGWHLRVPWYVEGVMRTFDTVEPVPYRFVVVEKQPPYIVQMFELDERAIAWGEKLVRRALMVFAECQETGIWPAYGQGLQTIGLPSWAEFRMADAEAQGRYGPAAISDRLGDALAKVLAP